MSRLIYADELLKNYQTICSCIRCEDCQFNGEWGGKGCQLEAMINNAPTVDAVEVVRCKDCKYAHMTVKGECKYCDFWDTEDKLYLDGDFFCGGAEKREVEE